MGNLEEEQEKEAFKKRLKLTFILILGGFYVCAILYALYILYCLYV